MLKLGSAASGSHGHLPTGSMQSQEEEKGTMDLGPVSPQQLTVCSRFSQIRGAEGRQSGHVLAVAVLESQREIISTMKDTCSELKRMKFIMK